MERKARVTVETLGPADFEDSVSVLSDAFCDYPVMRFVLGTEGDYDVRLDSLIRFFAGARFLRDETVFGVRRPDRRLLGTALVSNPGRPGPPELDALRQKTWAGLAGAMLAAVHALSASDSGSRGVTLTTEVEFNLDLYRHFGYEVLGSTEVASAFTTWSMYRSDE